VAKDGGKTAEELGDMQALHDAKNKPNDQSSSSGSGSGSGTDSDEGLPPPIPPENKLSFLPKLAIGGLGISTLAKDGEKTAEEIGDM